MTLAKSFYGWAVADCFMCLHEAFWGCDDASQQAAVGATTSSPPRAPSIGDWLRYLAADVTSFGAHTGFDVGPVTITVTVLAATATPLLQDHLSDAVTRL